MATMLRNIDSRDEVRRRAAEVRRKWSSLEKTRRTGLPPDVPAGLRQFILGESQPVWSTAVCRPGLKIENPRRTS